MDDEGHGGLERLEGKIEEIRKEQVAVEKRLDALDGKIDSVEKRLDAKIDAVEKRLSGAIYSEISRALGVIEEQRRDATQIRDFPTEGKPFDALERRSVCGP